MNRLKVPEFYFKFLLFWLATLLRAAIKTSFRINYSNSKVQVYSIFRKILLKKPFYAFRFSSKDDVEFYERVEQMYDFYQIEKNCNVTGFLLTMHQV